MPVKSCSEVEKHREAENPDDRFRLAQQFAVFDVTGEVWKPDKNAGKQDEPDKKQRER